MKKVNFIISFLFVSLMLFSCNNTDEVAPLPASSAGQYTVSDLDGNWVNYQSNYEGVTVLRSDPNFCDKIYKGAFADMSLDASLQINNFKLTYVCDNELVGTSTMIIDNQNIINLTSAGTTLIKYQILETSNLESTPKQLHLLLIYAINEDLIGITYYLKQ